MKNLLISIFAFSLATAAPTVLLAQDDHHDSAPHGAMSGPPADHGTPSGGTDRMDQHTAPMSSHTTPMVTHHTVRHRTTHHTTTVNHTTINNHSTTRVKVDVSSYRKAFNAPNHYHFGDYHGPADYSYHRWNTGDNLPREYWAQNYWLNNYLNFGLIAPPDGYVWVRYGPDAVLIDEDTGDIIQVEYGVFY
jgi:Ni/Co efflux regulator RcnB